MADTRVSLSPGICHTCVTVLEKYGTTESVVSWLCTCTKLPHVTATKSVILQDKLSWSKMSPEVQRITWRQNPPSR